MWATLLFRYSSGSKKKYSIFEINFKNLVECCIHQTTIFNEMADNLFPKFTMYLIRPTECYSIN